MAKFVIVSGRSSGYLMDTCSDNNLIDIDIPALAGKLSGRMPHGAGAL